MLNRIAEYYKSIGEAARVSGRNTLDVLREALFLRVQTGGALGLTEYLDLCLYRNDWYSASQKKNFAGLRLVHDIDVSSVINKQAWEVFAADKLAFYLISRGADIAIPETLACYSEHQRYSGPIQQLYTPESLHGFLQENAEKSLFVKPVSGSYGAAAHSLCVDTTGAKPFIVETSKGRQSLSFEDYERFLTALRPRHRSMMFQVRLEPHAKMRELAGPNISGIRIGVVKRENKAKIYAAVLKINAGHNITDNFEHGSSGNLLANVDLETGTLTRVINGAGIKAQEITHHPGTGMEIIGSRIPDWEQASALSLQTVEALPGLNLVGVDVAITDRGPVVLEVNAPGDFDLLQIASRKGVLSDPDVRAVIEKLH